MAITWLLFTVLGTLLGVLLPDPERLGVDFALITMFIAIFVGQYEALKKRVPVRKIGLILSSVLIVYLVAASLLTGSLAVLVATLAGCFVGVMVDVH